MDKWEATYRNDCTSDHYVSEALASRMVYEAAVSRVPEQPRMSMTWQADDSSVAIINSLIASQI